MLKDIILDYGDMAVNGINKLASAENSTNKYAVLIKTAESTVGKFPIGSVNEIKQSIFAIENNDKIPSSVIDTAKYYVKQAALANDIVVNWETSKSSRIINESELYPKVAEESFSLNIKGDLFPMTGPLEVKLAEDYFIANIYDISAVDRMRMANAIVKSAKDMNIHHNSLVTAYDNPRLGNLSQKELSLRKVAMKNDVKYIELLDKMGSTNLDAIEFITTIELADKLAGYNPRQRGHDHLDFFRDKDVQKIDDNGRISKIASLAESKDVATLLNNII